MGLWKPNFKDFTVAQCGLNNINEKENRKAMSQTTIIHHTAVLHYKSTERSALWETDRVNVQKH